MLDSSIRSVAAKPGLVQASAAKWVGQLHVVDIGAPRALVEETFLAPEHGDSNR